MLWEAVACAAVLCAVLLWLGAGLAPPRRRVLAAALAIGASLGSGWAANRFWTPPPEEQEVANRPIQVSDDGYVSSSACEACHPANYRSWHVSWHRTMTQVASPEAVVGDFGAVEVAAYGRLYRLERRGDGFWVEMEDPAAREPGAPRVERQILLTTGSHHAQDYWYETGHTRKLGLLPLMYLIEERRWIPFGAGFLQPPSERLPQSEQLDRWHSACIKCHATHGKPRTRLPRDDVDMDTTVAEFGIGCEACHGPGAEHVRANRSPLRRYGLHLSGGSDPTIVHPGELAPERASQVCGQCHGITRPLQPMPRQARRADDWRDHGLAYRPGEDLARTRYVVRARDVGQPRFEQIRAFDPHLLEDRFWADGMVRVSGREYNGLIESPCFVEGRGERKLSCLSCHSMHGEPADPRPLTAWRDDQLKPGMEGDGACLPCHAGFAAPERLVAHTRHEADSTGSRCMNCHMPYTTYGLLKAIRSHTVSSPSVAESRDSGRPNACNQCHLDQTVAWTGRSLRSWYGTPELALPPVMAAVPASVVWALAGDAGQRVLAAWAMGWPPALEASRHGTGWVAPFLGTLLADPYDAVRIVALRSLRRQPGFADFAFDPLAPEAERHAAAARVAAQWERQRVAAGEPTDASFLVDAPPGALPAQLLQRIYAQRNDRRVWLRE